MGEFCAIPDEECSQATAHPWREAWAKLESAPTPTTREGALAAVAFVLDDTQPDGPSVIEPAHRSLLEAVKRYLTAA